jgi:hypothetical protein
MSHYHRTRLFSVRGSNAHTKLHCASAPAHPGVFTPLRPIVCGWCALVCTYVPAVRQPRDVVTAAASIVPLSLSAAALAERCGHAACRDLVACIPRRQQNASEPGGPGRARQQARQACNMCIPQQEGEAAHPAGCRSQKQRGPLTHLAADTPRWDRRRCRRQLAQAGSAGAAAAEAVIRCRRC